jgi:DNA-binding LacI/PurR family transcriptional regulator
MVLGAVVKDFSDPFFAAAIEALAVSAKGRGYNVLIGHAHGRDEAVALATVLETSLTDAIVLLGDMQDQPGLLSELRASRVPVVATWQGISKVEFPTVDVDDRVGIRQALDHLIELGHERIALVSAALPGGNDLRENAYRDIITERFEAVVEGYIQRVPNTLAGGAGALEALRRLPNAPTAVATTTDLVAVGVLHHAWSLGWAVPEQLSVVGYDDLYIAPHTVPPLTTVRMPLVEIIDEAVRLAVDLAQHRSLSRAPTVRRFEPSLVVRRSTHPVGH